MTALILSAIIFMVMLGGILLGALLRRSLPRHHLDDHAKDVVRLGAGLIGTMAALVLGLLIASAKGSFDQQTSQVTQITADLILLDNVLAQYGPEAQDVRNQMRSTIGPFADRVWREKEMDIKGPFETDLMADQVYLRIQKLVPHDDIQHSLHSRAVQISNDLAQTRFLLFVESENLIPMAFLTVLTFWLMIIFASYSLFSPLNSTAVTSLSLFALSAAGAIFLILELSRPFSGLLGISSAPLRNALGAL
jgi:hypothetical protein